MKKYLAYCRVSTKAQADRDNSLPTQKRIIMEYAERKELEVVEWYSEAKSGFKGKRTEFKGMLEHLKDPSIEGVIFHKLDRSSRNVGDFSLLDKLMTNEKKKIIVIEGEFDTSRAAGRLAFRNFCNMCVWYSENLSEEVTTKMEEVLMRGYYPTNAPLGYREGIKGQDPDFKKKYHDPMLAPFVKECFELFATGNYSMRSLCEYMRQKGMTNKKNSLLRKGVFERMLRETFYYGLMSWGKRRGKVRFYEGNHEPLISKKLFDQVQEILDGRTQRIKTTRDFTYSKMIKCECGHYLVSSMHKGFVYLACSNKDCKTTSIREDRLEDQIMFHLGKYETEKELFFYYETAVEFLRLKVREDTKEKRQALNMKVIQLDKKLDNLHEAVLNGLFDADEAVIQKNRIVSDRHTLRSELETVENKMENALWDTTLQVIQLFNSVPYRFKELNPLLKRRFLNLIFENIQLHGNKVLLQAIPALERIKNTNNFIQGEKLRFNHLQHAEKPLEKAIISFQKEEFSPELLNGRGDWTRTSDHTAPSRVF